MHTYRMIDGKWSAGLWGPETEYLYACWESIRSFEHEWEAAAFTSWINGGKMPITLLRKMGWSEHWTEDL